MATFNPAKKKVRVSVLASATTLLTQANALDEVYCLNFCNTTNSDINLAVYELDADGSTKHYLIGGGTIALCPTVPANGILEWTGSCILDAASETVKAIASATGVDCNGGYLEYT